MKPPLPPVPIPGKTEFERFDNAMRRVLSVSKQELVRREEAKERVKRNIELSKELCKDSRQLIQESRELAKRPKK